LTVLPRLGTLKHTMASLYQRARSPYWWIKYRDANGKIVREATGFRHSGPDTRRAQQLRAERTLVESKTKAGQVAERWENWVADYYSLRYADAPASLLRCSVAWRTLRMFLEEKQVFFPRQLTRSHCVEYMAWRQKPNKSIGKYKAGHNTAHLEIKFLGIIMAEAVLRNYAPFNPCRDLEIKRVRGREKPELTAEAHTLIERQIAKEREPMRTFFRNSYDIARYHGARLSETYLNPMTDVDLNGPHSRIRFKAKGGKMHTVLLHPDLLPLFTRLRNNGAIETYPKPASPAKEWHKFLKRAGVKALLHGACFHSTRVTVASILARSGVSEKKAMAYIGHASTTVYRSYVRLQPDDLRECSAAISYGDKSRARKNSGARAKRPSSRKPARIAPSNPSPS
jgi:hypothetical protein